LAPDVKVAIVGCGLIGHKRAESLGAHELVACFDQSWDRARGLAAQHTGAVAATDIRSILSDPGIDAVVVATTHDNLASTALAVVGAGKHVLVEKPAARRAGELVPVREQATERGLTVKVGFNHRFHPAVQKAKRLVEQGGIGDVMFIRGRYGHGGRPGYEREWRADPRVSGGGELLDQGTHLIDLARWFMGQEFVAVSGHLATYYWPMHVEDNAFVSLATGDGRVAWLHASWTEWKNLFSFEIAGRRGKLQIDGLGGSYGLERVTFYRMLPELGPPETTSWEYPAQDTSWRDEFAHFADCVNNGTSPCGSLQDAYASLQIVERLYQENGRDYHT
jgi:predicted dehydrogenase